jgi:hypothetical protein
MGRPLGAKNKPKAPKRVRNRKPRGMIAHTYNLAWEDYRDSEAYLQSVRTLTNQTYSPKQPFIDTLISKIFQEGYNRKK